MYGTNVLIPGSSVNEVTDYRDSTSVTDTAHRPALRHVKASVHFKPDLVSRDREVEGIVSCR
jgi:hypothetical protein